MKLVSSFDVSNKVVLVRSDLNVPLKDGKILDDERIVRSMKTICYLLDHDAKVIVLSHLGKVKEVSDLKSKSLKQIFSRFNELTNNRFSFVEMNEMSDISNKIANMDFGRGLLLENTRFYDLDGKRESKCDLELAEYFASLADLFVNDAFGTVHRKHASNYGVSLYLPSTVGFLMADELTHLEKLRSADAPYIVVMGGTKVSDKIALIDTILPKVDHLLIGGAMAFTFLKAKGLAIGKSMYEDSMISYCNDLLNKYGKKIVLPDDFNGILNNEVCSFAVDNIPDNFIGYDVGAITISKFKTYFATCKTLFWNGPLGVYEDERFEVATNALFAAISGDCFSILGGGDIVSAYHAYLETSKKENVVTFLSTGGGATLSYLADEELPGLAHVELE